MPSYYADLHVHIGRTREGAPVKITASDELTLTNVLSYAQHQKGMDLVGVIDCHVPSVQRELEDLIESGDAYEHSEGGIIAGSVTLYLGTEIEVYDDRCSGPIHVLCYVPTLDDMKQLTSWLAERMTNITLSSQRFYGTGIELQNKVKELDGLFIPAHIFTPFKSLYGKGVKASLGEVFHREWIDAVELGLSANSEMASQLSELSGIPFLTNSDAHSLPKMAREYTKLSLQDRTFNEFKRLLRGEGDRKILANYGMNPLLGKYYSTVCRACGEDVHKDVTDCPNCGEKAVVKGVSTRVEELATAPKDDMRPPYINQVPLESLPKLGPKTLKKLLDAFGTEMAILHKASREELHDVVGEALAERIIAMREGRLHVEAGGGGKYGRVK
ncbi:hypothetical protein N781_18265 [Pontibacillus halophilus JSM 076056 = DSM 19796]|uniref:TIGR00375 family protein n=1 Tax=Pontibacillus halophilus JSM 076056 = DSM 19796 TaxID=1385510 RepID=A0A0A5GJQ9_9BACI|nr:endonuclease Q family protein [Pontibacillus halophilus]KGX92239.1 hypothetical protein N781_18265 [Pontibacillus halophilus JSM 076056 = DSM 19796]